MLRTHILVLAMLFITSCSTRHKTALCEKTNCSDECVARNELCNIPVKKMYVFDVAEVEVINNDATAEMNFSSSSSPRAALINWLRDNIRSNGRNGKLVINIVNANLHRNPAFALKNDECCKYRSNELAKTEQYSCNYSMMFTFKNSTCLQNSPLSFDPARPFKISVKTIRETGSAEQNVLVQTQIRESLALLDRTINNTFLPQISNCGKLQFF